MHVVEIVISIHVTNYYYAIIIICLVYNNLF